jgi:hypothetical protein
MECVDSIANILSAGTSDARTISLLGGYVDGDGRTHRDVDLAPLNGDDEDLLRRLPPDAPLASAVTGLLHRCIRRLGTLGRPSLEVVRDLLVGDRDLLMLKLRELTLGPRAWLTLRCPLDDCGKRMDLNLDLRELPIQARPVHTRYFAIQGLPSFRLPTGGDQEEVAKVFAAEPTRAVRQLLERCLGSDGAAELASERSSALFVSLEDQMGRLAPALEVELDARCPECDQEFTRPLDLVPWLVGELRDLWERLAEEVHVIAWSYHWSERDILALAHSKRSQYMKLIQRQLELGPS